MALDTLVDLLERNEVHAAAFDDRLEGHGEGQHPAAVTVCCSDSRVLQDAMWGNEKPGALFTVGNIGNRVRQATDGGPVVSGDVLYPLVHTGTDTAVVVGHTGCGAVTAAYETLAGRAGTEPDGIAACVDMLCTDLRPAYEALSEDVDDEDAVTRLVEANVHSQVEHLLASDDVSEDTTVAGLVYDLHGAYGGDRGAVKVVNVDGDTDPGATDVA